MLFCPDGQISLVMEQRIHTLSLVSSDPRCLLDHAQVVHRNGSGTGERTQRFWQRPDGWRFTPSSEY